MKLHNISEKVVSLYQSIEKGTVSGYKKVESGAVKTYKAVENFFVAKLFARKGETAEEAKARLQHK